MTSLGDDKPRDKPTTYHLLLLLSSSHGIFMRKKSTQNLFPTQRRIKKTISKRKKPVQRNVLIMKHKLLYKLVDDFERNE